jgi:hypothetical protein
MAGPGDGEVVDAVRRPRPEPAVPAAHHAHQLGHRGPVPLRHRGDRVAVVVEQQHRPIGTGSAGGAEELPVLVDRGLHPAVPNGHLDCGGAAERPAQQPDPIEIESPVERAPRRRRELLEPVEHEGRVGEPDRGLTPAWLRQLDPRAGVALHLTRFIGLYFLVLFERGGAALERPGLLDLLSVVATAARLALRDPDSMAALLRLPLGVLPTFLVPLLIASHVGLFARLRASNDSPGDPGRSIIP